MDSERFWLFAASFAYALCAVPMLYLLSTKKAANSKLSALLMAVGFTCQTVALTIRGQAVGHCPLGNLHEVLAFISWSLALTYLAVGPTFRLSILGFFTAPFVLLLNLVSLVLPAEGPRIIMAKNWVLELHASLCVMGFGIFALAALAAVMYLIQESQLKSRVLTHWFYDLPAMSRLEEVHRRILWWAYLVFTVGVGSGFFVSHASGDSVKIIWSVAVWFLYSLLLFVPRIISFSHKKVAWLSIIGCLFVMLTFWGVNSYSVHHRFSGLEQAKNGF